MQICNPPEVWAGVECTINRVGDRYFKQLERNGHLHRLSDLDLFAALGIKKIRYPVLWEQIAPGKLEDADWSWADERLTRLRELGIDPIVGFVHHGSGPSHTSLTDPLFPEQLATYAQVFAHRYPWVKYYTPVNEPLTTARFSGLYGHWYPHGKSNTVFFTTLLTQCKAVVLCMQAIRAIVPDAQLMQTEDLCKIFSTPLLQYQADYENERRWLSLDLLHGKVDKDHALWSLLLGSGVTENELHWFRENIISLNIIGINHYPTSNRFLDEAFEKYPEHYHGGNGTHLYADVEAVSIQQERPATLYVLLKEVWERYGAAMVISEAHICGHREEQLRWFLEYWETARLLCRQHIPVKAVTAWSLLGAYDWNCLVTRDNGFYESGVFDLRSPFPRATALAGMLQKLSSKEPYKHPLLEIPGVWRRPDRLKWPATAVLQTMGNLMEHHFSPIQAPAIHRVMSSTAPVLILGAGSALATAFAAQCKARFIPYRLLSSTEADLATAAGFEKRMLVYNPWAVIDATAYTDADKTRPQLPLFFQHETEGPGLLAAICARHNIQLLAFSTDAVFDGTGSQPYLESNTRLADTIYGRNMAAGERLMQDAFPGTFIIRLSACFGLAAGGFRPDVLHHLYQQKTITAATDIFITPTYLGDLMHAAIDLLIDRSSGVWHVSNGTHMSWYAFAQSAALLAALDPGLVRSHPVENSTRARNRMLSSERGILLPPVEDALQRYISVLQVQNQPLKIF